MIVRRLSAAQSPLPAPASPSGRSLWDCASGRRGPCSRAGGAQCWQLSPSRQCWWQMAASGAVPGAGRRVLSVTGSLGCCFLCGQVAERVAGPGGRFRGRVPFEGGLGTARCFAASGKAPAAGFGWGSSPVSPHFICD